MELRPRKINKDFICPKVTNRRGGRIILGTINPIRWPSRVENGVNRWRPSVVKFRKNDRFVKRIAELAEQHSGNTKIPNTDGRWVIVERGIGCHVIESIELLNPLEIRVHWNDTPVNPDSDRIWEHRLRYMEDMSYCTSQEKELKKEKLRWQRRKRKALRDLEEVRSMDESFEEVKEDIVMHAGVEEARRMISTLRGEILESMEEYEIELRRIELDLAAVARKIEELRRSL